MWVTKLKRKAIKNPHSMKDPIKLPTKSLMYMAVIIKLIYESLQKQKQSFSIYLRIESRDQQSEQ